MYLCTFDVMGIQQYIFRSNALRDNVGASRIIDRVIGDTLFQAGAGAEDNPFLGKEWEKVPAEKLDVARAVLVYASGGSAQVVLRERADAERLVQEHRKAVLLIDPDLNLAVDVMEWRPDTESFSDANDRQRRRLALRKSAQVDIRLPNLPPALERCQRTRSAALVQDWDADQNPEWISRGVRAQRWELGKAESARDAYAEALEQMRSMGLCVSNQIDAIRGRTQEQSYIGLIHVDVNGMGKVFDALAKGGDSANAQLSQIRDASEQVEKSLQAAMGKTLKWLLNHIKDEDGKWWAFDKIPLHNDPTEGKPAIPIRPIVIAGDEITLVAEGSIAIDLAAFLTEALLDALRRNLKDQSICASVGVALGKAHAPFSRLYALAEASCREAKKAALDPGGSWLDYRFLEESVPGDQSAPATDLSFRPFALEPVKGVELTFSQFRTQIVNKLQGPDGREMHTQLKSLAGDFTDGKDAVERRLALWKDRGMSHQDLFAKAEYVKRSGGNLFIGGRSPYLDGLTLMDFMVQLPETDNSSNSSKADTERGGKP